MAKRVILFLLMNLAVMFVLNIVLQIIFKVTGIQGGSTAGILVMSAVFGFAGSLISLFLSKTMALRSVGAEIITTPRTQAEQWLFNTVQRQAQQANIPMPDIAIYHSADVNAFATGATKSNSLVAVSTGLLKLLLLQRLMLKERLQKQRQKRLLRMKSLILPTVIWLL